MTTRTTTERLARRTRGLVALLSRQQVEAALLAEPETAPRWTPVLERIAAVASEEAPMLNDVELQLLNAPWGAFAESDLTLAAWRIEHVAVLLRALGGIGRLPLDRPVDAALIEEALPLFPSVAAIVERAQTHTTPNLDDEWRDHALWRWRCDVEWKHRHGGQVPGGGAFAAFVDERVTKMGLPTCVAQSGARDLDAAGSAVQDIPKSELSTLRCLHQERADAVKFLAAPTSGAQVT